MTVVVFDSSVVVQAIYWPQSTARRALAGLARRQFRTAVTAALLAEYVYGAERLRARFTDVNPSGAISWLRAKSRVVDPAPLGRQRSRDPKDDPVLACAVAAGAAYVISQDRDLLDLEKPFGIAIVTPVQFLREIEPRH